MILFHYLGDDFILLDGNKVMNYFILSDECLSTFLH
jgi:hypothetical protein